VEKVRGERGLIPPSPHHRTINVPPQQTTSPHQHNQLYTPHNFIKK